MRVKLRDVARIIRSKNAGPYELTLDVLCRDRTTFERLRAQRALCAERIAAAYRMPVEDVKDVIHFDPAWAVKIVLRRRVPSGGPGDGDVYGAQQHAPLLDLEIDLHEPDCGG